MESDLIPTLLILLVVATPTLIIIGGTVIRLIRSFSHDYEMPRKDDLGIRPISYLNYKLAPFFIVIIGPIGGLFISYHGSPYTKYDELYTPISHEHLLTVSVFYFIAMFSFCINEWKETELPPMLRAFSLIGMAQGFVLCLVLSVQLGGFMLVGLIPIGITFPALCPPLFAMLIFISIKKDLTSFEEIGKEGIIVDSGILDDNFMLKTARKVIRKANDMNPLILFLCIPFMAIQQAILVLFGQQPDSFIKAFTETATYTFSQHLPPPPPDTGHYLCTIAVRGHYNLVQPTRVGWRGGRQIYVNRQLMIANAFEEWLEDYMPLSHAVLRWCYERTGKPLNNCVKNKWISSLFFILMKPWEWFFLAWLYLFDKKPESRIQRQYFPRDWRNKTNRTLSRERK
ncbi:MAG: DUF6688 domain-containing protein [Saprospiraceae bacterium]